jgi:hypothetical protein
LAQWVDPVIKALEKADSSYEESLYISELSEIKEEPTVVSLVSEQRTDRIEVRLPFIIFIPSILHCIWLVNWNSRVSLPLPFVQLLRRNTKSPVMFSDDESGSDKAASDDENDMDLSFAV